MNSYNKNNIYYKSICSTKDLFSVDSYLHLHKIFEWLGTYDKKSYHYDGLFSMLFASIQIYIVTRWNLNAFS